MHRFDVRRHWYIEVPNSTTKLVMVINKAHIKIILLMAFYIVGLYYYIFLHFVVTIKHNAIAYLGCVVDNMADYVSYVYSITRQ